MSRSHTKIWIAHHQLKWSDAKICKHFGIGASSLSNILLGVHHPTPIRCPKCRQLFHRLSPFGLCRKCWLEQEG